MLTLPLTALKARLGCDKHSVAEDYAFFHPKEVRVVRVSLTQTLTLSLTLTLTLTLTL